MRGPTSGSYLVDHYGEKRGRREMSDQSLLFGSRRLRIELRNLQRRNENREEAKSNSGVIIRRVVSYDINVEIS
jgi:hypothetical protein